MEDPSTDEDSQAFTSLNNPCSTASPSVESVFTNVGVCGPRLWFVNLSFMQALQKFHSAVYLVCVVIVIILYGLIYRAVLVRRTRREQQRSKSLSLVVALKSTTQPLRKKVDAEETLFTDVYCNNDIRCDERTFEIDEATCGAPSASVAGGGPRGNKLKFKEMGATNLRRGSNKRELTRIANIKTAAMLFVVTLVFIVTYFPALLMALRIVPYKMIVFYMYFANNVANPVIYSFMNQNFRDDTRKLFSRRY